MSQAPEQQPRRTRTRCQQAIRPRMHLVPSECLLDHPLLLGTNAGRQHRKRILAWYSAALAGSVAARLHSEWTAQLIARTADAMAADALELIRPGVVARLK